MSRGMRTCKGYFPGATPSSACALLGSFAEPTMRQSNMHACKPSRRHACTTNILLPNRPLLSVGSADGFLMERSEAFFRMDHSPPPNRSSVLVTLFRPASAPARDVGLWSSIREAWFPGSGFARPGNAVDFAGRGVSYRPNLRSMASQMSASRQTSSKRLISCRPVGEVTLISVR